jgi:hypothetical protein
VKDLIGNLVSWEKLEGKFLTSAYEKIGFGSLDTLELDKEMRIYGDYGLFSSTVKGIEIVEEGIKVTTLNSVYLIKPWK